MQPEPGGELRARLESVANGDRESLPTPRYTIPELAGSLPALPPGLSIDDAIREAKEERARRTVVGSGGRRLDHI